MSKVTCLIMWFLAVSLHSVLALTSEELATIRKDFEPIVAACSTAHGVSPDDILKSAKENKNPSDIAPCFLGCVFKMVGVLNDQGMYNAETGLDKIAMYVRNENEKIKFEKIAKKCASVNQKDVGDGPAGCERAKLLLSCILQNKGELPF